MHQQDRTIFSGWTNLQYVYNEQLGMATRQYSPTLARFALYLGELHKNVLSFNF